MVRGSFDPPLVERAGYSHSPAALRHFVGDHVARRESLLATAPMRAHRPLAMAFRFHEGERAVQERAGTRAMADKIGNSIRGELSDVRAEFLASLRFAIVAAADADGRLWTTARFGEPGFLRVVGEADVRIDARAPLADPLAIAFEPAATVGLLAIQLVSRKRVRLNGTVAVRDARGMTIRLHEVFGNCPKYIQSREVRALAPAETDSSGLLASRLSEDAKAQIVAADTFFFATRHPERGVDVSHRGGRPGFVRVTSERTLEWPDYSGNGMFQSLGNLAVDPAAALLFVDFDGGRTLHLTGRATVDWSMERAAAHAGAERVVIFELDEAREIAAGSPLRFELLEPSAYNPR